MREIDKELLKGFCLGSWRVDPSRGLLQRDATRVHVEPLVMDVLLLLASNQGSVVSKDDFVRYVWDDRAIADDVITSKISALRRHLGDNRQDAEYVETVQKRGYRLKMPIDSVADDKTVIAAIPDGRNIGLVWVIGISVVAVALYALWPGGDQIESVAVMQFRNLSDDTDKFQYVVDGFSEELVVSLDQIPDLRITRGPAESNGQSARELADELGVDAIIRGSLRTDGTTLRVTLELVSSSGFQLWADRIDAQSRDIFDTQERVAARVRNELDGGSPAEIPLASRPANSDAFDRYILGTFHLRQRDPASLGRALALFQEAKEFDPGFGPAYLRQAIAQLLLSAYETGDRQDSFDKALAIAAAGAVADPAIAEPIQVVNGFVHHQRGEWYEAERAYSAAINASTVYPTAPHWYSIMLGDVGFSRQALAQAQLARQMEPGSQPLNSRLAIAYLAVDDLQNAEHYFQIASSMEVGIPDHYFFYAVFLLRERRFDDARDRAVAALQLAQRPFWWVDPVFESIAEPSDAGKRQVSLATIETMIADPSVPRYIPMMLLSSFGEYDHIMAIAQEKAAADGVLKNSAILFSTEFTRLRQHPAFPDLLEDLGLTRYWSGIGCAWRAEQLICGDG